MDRSGYSQKWRETWVCQYDFENFENYIYIFLAIPEDIIDALHMRETLQRALLLVEKLQPTC